MNGDRQRHITIVKFKGSMIRAESNGNGFLVCPICKAYIFTTEEDLMRHIMYHARSETPEPER